MLGRREGGRECVGRGKGGREGRREGGSVWEGGREGDTTYLLLLAHMHKHLTLACLDIHGLSYYKTSKHTCKRPVD